MSEENKWILSFQEVGLYRKKGDKEILRRVAFVNIIMQIIQKQLLWCQRHIVKAMRSIFLLFFFLTFFNLSCKNISKNSFMFYYWSVAGNPQIWRADCSCNLIFGYVGVGVPTPVLFKGQLYSSIETPFFQQLFYTRGLVH